MALLDSLLSAIVRAEGDALVMHVGERPYVVVDTQTINISTHGMNLDAMTSMLTQLLPADSLTQLEEFGAVEYKVPQQGQDGFSVVAARGGDDVWIEIRRQRLQPAPAASPSQAAAAPPIAAPEPQPVIVPETAPVVAAEPIAPVAEPIPEPIAEPIPEPIPEPIAQSAPEPIPEPVAQAVPEAVAAVAPEPIAEIASPPVAAVAAEPIVEVAAQLMTETLPEPIAEVAPQPIAELAPQVVPELVPEPVAETAPEPVPEVAPEPVAEVAPEPVAEVAPEQIAQPVPEPIAEPIAQVDAIVAQPEPSAESAPEAPSFELVPPPAVEHVEAVAEDIAPVMASADVEAALPLESELEPAPMLAAIESIEPVEAILEEAPKIAALAETLETARVEEILEEAPKIAALAETLAAVDDTVQESVQEVQAVQKIQEVHQVQAVHEVQAVHVVHEAPAAHEAPAVQAAGPVERLEPVEPSEPLERIEPLEPLEPTAPPADHPVVVPMTRTVRIEVPPRTPPASTPAHGASGIDRLLRVAAARGASALFLTPGSRPWIRVEGDLRFLDSEAPLSRAEVESAMLEIAPEHDRESIGRGEAAEWIVEFEGVGRLRCSTFSDHRGPGLLVRLIATRAATAEQLGLAREIQTLATEPQGLVLVAGPRASGKSTMISALVDLINRQRADYVITLERQVRLVHDNRKALVSQREIRGAADESVAAARSALRESPDVLVVDDLVSPHMVPLLLTAASEGLLVFVSIAAPSTADAVARFVELAPPEMRKAVHTAMAESFRGAVAQLLLKKAGGGLVAAREILLATGPVTRVIGEGQHNQLPLTLDNGRKHGMVSFTDALADYVRSGTVDVREAFRKAPDRPRLLETLKRDGVDTSVVERLA